MNTSDILISVIVPAYDVERYLSKCIDSVIKQTHQNFELILINDGSHDASGSIADQYAAKDKRIRVIHKSNGGVSSARNAGIDIAAGEYICFIDGDDWVEADYIEYLLQLVKKEKADISLVPNEFSIMHPTQTKHDRIDVYDGERAVAGVLYSNIPEKCGGKLYKRSFLNKHALRFQSEFCVGEGFNFTTSTYQRANKIVIGHKKIYNYRLDNVDSVTTKFDMDKWENGLEALLNIKRNFIIKTKALEDAWDFAWWLTNYNIIRLMIGASVQRKYSNEYKRCLDVVKNNAPRLDTVPGSIGRKGRILIIKSNVTLAAKIDNFRRNRVMKKVIKTDGAIVCITTNNNYGNVIQRWAMQRFLHNNGYNFVGYYFYGYYLRQYLPRQTRLFAPLRIAVYTLFNKRSVLRPSSSFYNYRSLSKFCNERINQELFVPGFLKKYKTYIVGSDQVFNYKVTCQEFLTPWSTFLLDFVKWPAKRIAYAPSFGSKKSMTPNVPLASAKAKELAKRFDAMSSREDDGVRAIKSLWNVDAREVVDPTLLLQASDYRELIDNPVCALKKVEPVFYYILRDDAKDTLQSFAKSVAKQIGKDVDGITGYNRHDLPAMEQWLAGFADAEFVVTDSFHGAVFSIINHKDFIVICSAKFKNGGGFVRQYNLLKKLGLLDRVVYEEDFASFKVDALQPIDWSDVDAKLANLRDNSANWLLSQLGSKDEN